MSGTIGRYQILSRLGPAQDNEVYKGFDPMIERQIVIKIYSLARASAAAALSARQTFFEDIQRASTLDHPGIVTIFDVGETSAGLFLATEFVEGVSLSAALSAGLHLPLAARIAMIAQIGDALEHARERGVPHLAFEPTHVLVGLDGSLKIRGFGEARVVRALSSDAARDGQEDGDAGAEDARAMARVARAILGELWDTPDAEPARLVVFHGLSDAGKGFETTGAFRRALLQAVGLDDFDVRLAWSASHWMTAPGAQPPTAETEPSTDETRMVDAAPASGHPRTGKAAECASHDRQRLGSHLLGRRVGIGPGVTAKGTGATRTAPAGSGPRLVPRRVDDRTRRDSSVRRPTVAAAAAEAGERASAPGEDCRCGSTLEWRLGRG